MWGKTTYETSTVCLTPFSTESITERHIERGGKIEGKKNSHKNKDIAYKSKYLNGQEKYMSLPYFEI